jgi:dTDP-4-dehydrorhamnose 3,5-epimerase
MIVNHLSIEGVFVVESPRHSDERGWFNRFFCTDSLRDAGVEFNVSQINASHNHLRGTLRGLHFQATPYEEAKIVRCVCGAVYDVIVDLRPHLASFGKWLAVELSADNRKAVHIPKGCAHGFQALVDGSELLYLMDSPYQAGASRGILYNDPTLGIPWPFPVTVISERDLEYPSLEVYLSSVS